MVLVSVSGACSRAGKTALAVSLLRRLPAGKAAAVKFTAIARAGAVAPAWASVRRLVEAFPFVVMEGSTITGLARPDLHLFVVHPFLSPARWKPASPELIARCDAVVVNVPGRGSRSPSAAVMAEVERHRGAAPVILGDVTRPLTEWAPSVDARLGALASSATAALRA